MTSLTRLTGLLLLSCLAMPAGAVSALELAEAMPEASSQGLLIARGGGRGGGGGGHRAGGGGGGHRGQTGFKTAGTSFNRGQNKPAGGWSSAVGSDRARPSLDRPSGNRGGTRDLRPVGGQAGT
ncbi:MAG: hypothetical protein RLZZ124_1028, partial [Cyanobacteriota bacterium]